MIKLHATGHHVVDKHVFDYDKALANRNGDVGALFEVALQSDAPILYVGASLGRAAIWVFVPAEVKEPVTSKRHFVVYEDGDDIAAPADGGLLHYLGTVRVGNLNETRYVHVFET